METLEDGFIARIALTAIKKKMDYNELRYSDYLYGVEYLIDDVWVLVEECEKIGLEKFMEKYSGLLTNN